VRVATGDVNRDGIKDVVTAPGPGGGPHIRVFDGANGGLLYEFLAYGAGFFGGVFVATADFAAGGAVSIITGAGAGGGPHVKVFKPFLLSENASFLAYDASFTGGVTVAGTDATFDGTTFTYCHVITGAGPGGGPHVKAFEMNNPFVDDPNFAGPFPVHASFFAYEPSFTGGAFVAAGDANGDGVSDIITAAGNGGGPHIKAFNGLTGTVVNEFFAYDPNFRGGATVGTVDLDGDGRDEILTGAGPTGGPHVRAFRVDDSVALSFFAFDPAFTGGVYVG
jgi:hypothetical protein